MKEKGPQNKMNSVEQSKNIEEEKKNPVEDSAQIGEKQKLKQDKGKNRYEAPLYNLNSEADKYN